jgi:hypothetical protein
VVAAQVHLAARGQTQVEFRDGVLTGRGTFQKFYQQGELRAFLETALGCEAIPAGLGVFYVSKDGARQDWGHAASFSENRCAPVFVNRVGVHVFASRKWGQRSASVH